jgi:hypothetical protein
MMRIINFCGIQLNEASFVLVPVDAPVSAKGLAERCACASSAIGNQ